MSLSSSAAETGACAQLAVLAEKIASQNPQISARDFILALGQQAAGIRLGMWSFFDLLRGGRNLIPGNGFKPELDDHSGGQVRHFTGIAVSSVRFGPGLTTWLSENIRRDPAGSPDGRLTLLAVKFSKKLLKGELPVNAAAQWLRENLCNPSH